MLPKFIIGIDLGGTNLKIALLNRKYSILCKEVLSTGNFIKKESLIKAVVDAVNKIIKENRLKRNNIMGVGLGLPGPIDVQQGLVHFFPNIPGWRDVGLKSILENILKLPVSLDNDANLMSLAEYKLGAARGFRNVVCLTLGTGVGGGVVIEGKLYRGSSYSAGEIGHIPINEAGPKCNCGGQACLEAYIGNKRIMQTAKSSFKRQVYLEDLSKFANAGNIKAKAIWFRVARHLGIALVGVINLLNPDCVVIGGGVANAGSILFDKVKEIVRKQAMAVPAKHVKIFKAKLGNDAGLIGAAMLVQEKS